MYKIVINTVIIGLLSHLFALSTSWDMDKYRTNNPTTLLEKTFSNYSYQEKKYIRSYIAHTFPNTKEGLFSRAWIASANGYYKKRDKLYNQCVNDYDYAPCFYNGYDKYNKDIASAFEHFIRKRPALFDY